MHIDWDASAFIKWWLDTVLLYLSPLSQPQEEDKGEDDKSTQVRVETDISGLSKAKKMQLLKRESPEFLPLMEDMKSELWGTSQFLSGLPFLFIWILKSCFVIWTKKTLENIVVLPCFFQQTIYNYLSFFLSGKCNEIQTFLRPLMKGIQTGQVPNGPARQYIVTKYRLLLKWVICLLAFSSHLFPLFLLVFPSSSSSFPSLFA